MKMKMRTSRIEATAVVIMRKRTRRLMMRDYAQERRMSHRRMSCNTATAAALQGAGAIGISCACVPASSVSTSRA